MWKHLTIETEENPDGTAFDIDEVVRDLDQLLNEEPASLRASKHPYSDVINAWAEGKRIQYRLTDSDGVWQDWVYVSGRTPAFNGPGVEWRVKPRAETYRYTNALFFNGIKYWVEAIMEDEFSLDLMSDKEFVRCIGDWQTVEVEKEG
jgi:hypothetical protein